jgi:hypothetical protein
VSKVTEETGARPGEGAPETPDRGRAVRGRLVLASGLMLFLELALIRWLGANVVHLSYFSNFVLLGSFLGVGLGFLLARTRHSVLPWAPLLLLALVWLAHVYPVTVDRTDSQVIYFTSGTLAGPPAWLALPVIFLAVAATVMGPAEAAGRCFAQLPALTAYRFDLIGSLVGIVSFTGLSFLRAPSVVWGVIVGVCFVALSWRAPRLRLAVTAVASLGTVLVLLAETLTPGVTWSPYYKVVTQANTAGAGDAVVDISVNGIPHQRMRSAAMRLKYDPQYGLPYTHVPGNPLGRVLIVGAGSGSDVAIALAKGAQHVDAVDIDPRILQIGEQRHPDHPYQDPRVSIHVNDGRAFLQQSDQKYDLILFALPDSLALVTGASQIRLESYLFTEEAIASARAHLAPGGAFAMYNYYREQWLVDRLAGTVKTAFGHTVCVDQIDRHQAVITAGLTEQDQRCTSAYQPAAAPIAPASDDRPFLYFQGGMLPTIYLTALAGILLVSLVAARVVGGPLRQMRPYADLFFMGAAFLLLETKSVTTFALLFGTTWAVNAMVFTGVLVAVLLAVETTRRLRTPPLPVVYAGIAVSLLVAWLVPASALLGMSLWPRLVAATALAFAPIYLANIAFAKRFATSGDSRSAFAANLLGAIVGGALEYTALLIGYHMLIVVVGVLYLLAFVLTPRRTAPA